MHKDKKFNILKYFDLLRLFAAICIALIITSGIIFLVSENPAKALSTLLLGPVSSKRYLFNVLEMMVPLMFTGLSLSLVFKSGNFSMITDASFYMGAVIASFVAIMIPLPAGVHPMVAIVIAGFIGGIIGSIPAFCKVKYKANELVTSLMLNYVFFYAGLYIINKFLADRQASNFASLKFLSSAQLSTIVSGTRLHSGFIIAIVVCILLYIFLTRTKWGYEIRIVGSNPEFARYSGINTKRCILYTSFISGFIAAIGGAIEKLGMYRRFQWAQAPTYAWDGVIISILSSNNPIFIPVAAFFLSYVRVGADIMSRQTDVQNEIVALIQGVIILLVTAERFLYFIKQRKESQLALANNESKGGDK
ncbi:ABC transporter permease [Terrisporobacter glycolicus]|uniref:Branched-chain amino acid ABC transporter, permease protein n=1 Tax=Terrisporobacter glycolicus ATCC 14880 = DSM 1288 TaxID=1121315 RepID=A0ABZ2EXV8_9FIRM|nr:ABC transporter permease [Terrisporobacter glycolicus]